MAGCRVLDPQLSSFFSLHVRVSMLTSGMCEHDLCSECTAPQHLHTMVSAGSGRSLVPGGCTYLFIFGYRTDMSHRMLLSILQLRRKPVCWFGGGDSHLVGRQYQRVCGWEGVFPNTASATTGFVLQLGCLCNMENYHYVSLHPPRNKHFTAEEAGCKCSHNRCCEKWHSSHKQPLRMLCEPHA